MYSNKLSKPLSSLSYAYTIVRNAFLRYAIIRATRLTNNVEHIEEIAASSLLMSLIFIPRLSHDSEFPELLELFLQATELDVLESNTEAEAAGVFLFDDRMYKLTEALNHLEPFFRQLLVLYHIGMLSTEQISSIYEISTSQIRFALADAKSELAEQFSAFWYLTDPDPTNACIWLSDLDDAIPKDLKKTIADYISVGLSTG